MSVKLGNANNNNLNGTSGVDLLNGFDGNDTLIGKAGSDYLLGSFGNDKISGGDGADLILDIEGKDVIEAGAGNDIALVSAWNKSAGGIKDGPPQPGLISANGGLGLDYLLLDASKMNVSLNLKLANGEKEVLPGGGVIQGFETGFVIGTNSSDNLSGSGWSFSNRLPVSSIVSSLNSQITNAALKEEVRQGGIALAAIVAFDGLSGGFGDDTLSVSMSAQSTAIASGLVITGDAGDDSLTLNLTGAALNALKAHDGKFSAPQTNGARALVDAIVVNGDSSSGSSGFLSGDDHFRLELPSNTNADLVVNATGQGGMAFRADGHFIFKASGIESFDLNLGRGDDRVTLGSGNDRIFAGAGNDTLSGGAGNDVFYGGDGADRINGGFGKDTVLFDTAVKIKVGSPASGTGIAKNDSFQSIEVYGLSAGADSFIGSTAGETVIGNAGNDILSSAGGGDTLSGGAGRDSIYGGANADILSGGSDNDFLSGGTGRDQFNFQNSNLGIDTINDFRSDEDSIGIGIGLGGFPIALIFLSSGVNPQAPVPFDPYFLYDTSNGYLSFDADGQGGNGAVHFATLVGAPDLLQSDLFFLSVV